MNSPWGSLLLLVFLALIVCVLANGVDRLFGQ